MKGVAHGKSRIASPVCREGYLRLDTEVKVPFARTEREWSGEPREATGRVALTCPEEHI